MTQNHGWTRNNLKWGPKHSDPMLIKDVPLDHFVSILNWIWNNFDAYEDGSPGLYEFMEGEARFRRLLAFGSGEPYPHKVGAQYRVKK